MPCSGCQNSLLIHVGNSQQKWRNTGANGPRRRDIPPRLIEIPCRFPCTQGFEAESGSHWTGCSATHPQHLSPVTGGSAYAAGLRGERVAIRNRRRTKRVFPRSFGAGLTPRLHADRNRSGLPVTRKNREKHKNRASKQVIRTIGTPSTRGKLRNPEAFGRAKCDSLFFVITGYLIDRIRGFNRPEQGV